MAMPVTELVPENSIEPIAVVGMSVRVPGAETLEQFWANLRDGVESIRFFSDEELLAAGVSAEDLANPDYVKACGALRDVESFDADFFSFTPREAETLDPQHRIFLECAWRALEHAGCDPQRYDGRIAVYGGVGLNGYLIHNLLGHRDLLATLGGWQLSLGNDKDFAVSRVSYKLNLQGPSIAVNTACSTSLVATAMGCQSLLNYQCDMVLAGGCSVHLPQDRGYFYHHGGTLSPDGHCRPFEAHAAGTIDGNGAAIVALKRLEDALVDGDEVYGVIRGFAVNNDGDLKVGYTAPSVEGQAEVIREAQEMAGISAADIHYVETHGTGTDLGDPVEMAALVEAFRASTANKGYCAIGSVKSNIGHLDTAAGTASLIKTLLAIRHGQIPPLLHFEAPNPKIDFARSPFYINGELIEWPRAGDAPRRAGVSSFGIGGTNAHIVVEEAPARSPSVAARDWQLLTLSAKSATALDQLSLDLADYVQENPQESMADIAHTLQVGRREFVHRRSVLVGDAGDAIENLRDLGAVRTYANVAASDPPVVFLFSGQDAQYIHMAAGLRGESAFANALAECSALLAEHGINLEELIWPGGGVGAPQFDAEFALDPVPLLAIEYALARLWQSWGVEPSAMLGYSLGEYVVAVLAGVLSLGDALGLAAAVRELLRATEPGALLGVALGAGEVQNELGATLYLAMVNGPRQCVVGGAPDAVEALHQRLLKRGVSAQPLPIARAFHTPMMQPLVDAFRQHLERVELQPPTLPYISCLTGDWISDAEATDPEHYLALATGTVQLDAALETLLADAICGEAGATLLEVSPAQTLSSLAAQHPRRPESVEIFSSLRDPRYQVSGAVGREKNGDQPTLLATLGRVWARGVAVDWSAFHLEQGRRRLALPGHPFQRQRYWVEPAPQGAEPTLVAAEQGKSAAVERWFYAPGWRRCPRPYSTATDAPIDWLVFADAGGVAEALAFRLETQGHRVVLVRSGSDFAEREDGFVLDLNSPEQLDRLLSELNASGRAPARIAHMALLGLSTEENQLLEQSFYGLLYLGRALGQHCFDSEVDLILLSDGLLAVGDAPALRPGKAVALGPLRVIPQEYPNIHTRALDIVPASEGRGRDALLCAMLAEFSAECTEPAVALRGNNRWVEHFDPLPLSAPADTPRRLRLQGTYLITGGLGQIGLTLADYLWRTLRANIVLTSRSPLPPEAEWQALVEDANTPGDLRRRLRQIRQLRAAGADVLCAVADVANAVDMERVFEQAEVQFGKINGVIHAAGLVGEASFATIKECERAECEEQFRPKIAGLAALEQVLSERDIDFCLLCSSLSPILGGLGFSAYAASNLYMDAVAERTAATAIPWLGINWEGWHFEDEPDLGGAGAAVAELGLSPEEGCDVFARLMDVTGLNRIVVSTGALERRIAQWVGGFEVVGDESGVFVAQGGRPSLLGEPVDPSTPTEEAMVDLWRRLLGIEAIGAQDNFFELGGNSLLLTQLVALMRRTFQVDLSLAELFNTPTVADIAAQIERQSGLFTDADREVGEI
jgi:phthiocerol/phenolphthiocerol synthesis type-I polyketide synthase E